MGVQFKRLAIARLVASAAAVRRGGEPAGRAVGPDAALAARRRAGRRRRPRRTRPAAEKIDELVGMRNELSRAA
jgi:hypothetical protein